MGRAVLFCNGELDHEEFHRELIREDDFIIAVDGGGRFCEKLGLLPSIAIGDFDSIDKKAESYLKEHNIERIPFPANIADIMTFLFSEPLAESVPICFWEICCF